MTSTVSSTIASFGIAGVLEYLLLISSGLVLAGLALAPRHLVARSVYGSVALLALGLGFLLTSGWFETIAVATFSVIFAPLLLGLLIIREKQVGVVIKKFASRNLPPGELIALHGEAGYHITPSAAYVYD